VDVIPRSSGGTRPARHHRYGPIGGGGCRQVGQAGRVGVLAGAGL